MKNNKHYAYESPFEMVDHDGVKYTLTVEQSDYPESPREWDNLCTMVCWHRRCSLGDKHGFHSMLEFMLDLYRDVMGESWFEKHESDDWSDVYHSLSESDLILIKPINAYEHGGITISTSNGYPYNDRWDAGCVGFVYVTKKTIFEAGCCLVEKDENGDYILVEHKHENMPSTYSYKSIPTTDDNWKEVADDKIESEMEVYDQYLRGDVYGFKLTKTVIEQELCPHCGEVISEYEEEVEEESCWGFYGDCLEDNGILDNLGNLKFVED